MKCLCVLKIGQDVDIKKCTRIIIRKKKKPQIIQNKTVQLGNEDFRKTGNTMQKIGKTRSLTHSELNLKCQKHINCV